MTFTPEQMKIIKIMAGALIGGALGFAYYKFVGCRTGTCPITSSPTISVIYGAIMGVSISA